MSLQTATVPTISDALKLLNGNDPVRRVGEMIVKSSELMSVMPASEGNGPDGHLVSYLSSIPDPTVVGYNEGAPLTRGTTDEYTESYAMNEMKWAIDKKLVERVGGDVLKVTQIRSHVLGMSQGVISQILYATRAANPKNLDGLIPRLQKLSGKWGKQIINYNSGASGSDQASVLLVAPDTEMGVHLIYPPGSPAGLTYRKLVDDWVDANNSGGKVFSERGEMNWRLGVAVEDPRSLARIGNIDMSALASDTTDNIIYAIIDAQSLIAKELRGKVKVLMPRQLRTFLSKRSYAKTSPVEFSKALDGQPVIASIFGMPILQEDNMLITEDVLAA